MKIVRKSIISVVILLISASGLLFFLPKPPLLTGIHYSTAVYDEHHRLLRLTLSSDGYYRLFTPLSKISPTLIETTLLQEDQYFWQHFGLNPLAVLKAGWQTYVVHKRRVGASTITMQVAHLRYKLNTKSLSGKFIQIIRALKLEMHYSKKEILEAYLNLAPYGHNIEGVGAASLIYFNKSAQQFALPEALALSVIPQNPSKRTPAQDNLKSIRNKLFARWLRFHPADLNQQAMMDLPLEMRHLHNLPFIAPHIVNHLLNTPSFKPQDVITTLDTGLQATLMRVTQHYILRQKSLGIHNAAVLLVDARDRSIKAAVGSVDFFSRDIQGQINGTEIKRSPGSTLKPLIYGLALDQGLIHPNSILKDVPHRFGVYNPENFDYDFIGPIKARNALILSRNIPAIELASQLANPNLYQLLEQAQVSQLKPESYYGLALSLGGAELSLHELTSLYVMLVNGGIWHPLRQRQDDPLDFGKRLLSPEASFLVLDILKDTPRPGSDRTPLDVAWKTGTSSGFRDAWSVGAFGPYVLTVWIGNFNNQSNPALIGKKIAAPLFFELIDAIRQEKGSLPVLTPYPENLNLKKVEVCKASGMLPTRYCLDREMAWFIPCKSPIKSDTIYREVAIDGRTGLRTCHIDKHTRFEIYEFWPTDLLKIFKQAGIQRRTPPPYAADCLLTNPTGLSPQITSPQAELRYIISTATTQNSKIPLTAVADGDVVTLHWFINETYLGKTHPDEPLIWRAKAGKFVVRVVDDHGRSDAHDIVVRYA